MPAVIRFVREEVTCIKFMLHQEYLQWAQDRLHITAEQSEASWQQKIADADVEKTYQDGICRCGITISKTIKRRRLEALDLDPFGP